MKGKRKTSTARVKRWRIAHPLRYAYLTLKHNAKRRGRPFELSQEEFEKFCQVSSYVENRGREAEALSVDRIDNDKGYEMANIQALTLSENSRKNDSNYCPF